MFWGTLSDRWGRRPMFIGCMVVLTLSCVGLALVPTNAYWLLMLLRCLQAAGSASTIALGACCDMIRFGCLNPSTVADLRFRCRGHFRHCSSLGARHVLRHLEHRTHGWAKRWACHRRSSCRPSRMEVSNSIVPESLCVTNRQQVYFLVPLHCSGCVHGRHGAVRSRVRIIVRCRADH